MKQAKRIIWGLVLIALGILYALNQLHILPFELFFPGWWTLFIIVPSIIALLTERDKIGALIGLLFGVFFLLHAWDILAIDLLWKLAVPIIIVLVGLKLVFGSKNKTPLPTPTDGAQDHARGVAVFSGHEMRFGGQMFRGAEVIAVFGGVELFAADALIQQDCVVRATTVFGGVDLHLPPTVNVQVVSNGLFGGVENHRAGVIQEGAPTVYVHSTAMFGGVEIR